MHSIDNSKSILRLINVLYAQIQFKVKPYQFCHLHAFIVLRSCKCASSVQLPFTSKYLHHSGLYWPANWQLSSGNGSQLAIYWYWCESLVWPHSAIDHQLSVVHVPHSAIVFQVIDCQQPHRMALEMRHSPFDDTWKSEINKTKWEIF